MRDKKSSITVYYDGKCGLCAKEIAYYKKIAPANVFSWIDITALPEAIELQGISLSEGLRLLHVKDESNTLHVGVDAFLCMWKALPRWRYLAKIIALPGIKQLTQVIYHYFARWRFKRLPHCQINK